MKQKPWSVYADKIYFRFYDWRVNTISMVYDGTTNTLFIWKSANIYKDDIQFQQCLNVYSNFVLNKHL